MSKHYPWPEIENFQHVKRNLDKQKEIGYTPPIVDYIPKIKLHGTNAAVQIHKSGEIIPQSRNNILSITGKDNAGFAKFVEENKKYFEGIQKKIISSDPKSIVIYGEFCGKGVQSGVAISNIDRKIFAVFAIKLIFELPEGSRWIFEPFLVKECVSEHDDIFILPWMNSHSVTINWNEEKSVQQAAAQINELVESVEKEDPWVKETFNVSGIGEGVVMYPLVGWNYPFSVCNQRFSDLIFKAKGEKHRVAKQKKPVQVEIANPSSVLEFVDLMVTEARLNQGLQEACQGEKDIKLLGNFLKWMSNDIKKEGLAELEAGNLSWKDVVGQINNRAKQWFMRK